MAREICISFGMDSTGWPLLRVALSYKGIYKINIMGFRSTLTAQDYGYDMPVWFKGKYKNFFFFTNTTIVSSTEFKMRSGNEFFEDYQKALIEVGLLKGEFELICAVLAEDGHITKVKITKDEIKYISMEEGREWQGLWNQGY